MSKKTKIQKIDNELASLNASRDEIRSAVRHFEGLHSESNGVVRINALSMLEKLYLDQYTIEGLIIDALRRRRKITKIEDTLRNILNRIEKK